MKIALLGLGTVGTGVLKIIEMNKAQISKYYHTEIEIVKILVSDIHKERNIEVDKSLLTDQVSEILAMDIDIVIEVMGGIDDTFNIIKKFLMHRVHVITANKDMLAAHLETLESLAMKNEVALKYEASIAGGIPIVNAINSGLSANAIHQFMGIFNGTSNFILSKMSNEQMDYESALRLAQQLGFAESDPTNDVEGMDAARKVAISCYLAFNRFVPLDEIDIKGITHIKPAHIKIASQLGYRIKLIGSGYFDGNQVTASVQPMCLPFDHQLAHVENEYNAIYIDGNAVGNTMYYGKGAGSLATGSAIVSDLLYVIEHMDSSHNLPLHLTLQENVQKMEMKYTYLIIIPFEEVKTKQESNWIDDTWQYTEDYYYRIVDENQLKLIKQSVYENQYVLYRIEGA